MVRLHALRRVSRDPFDATAARWRAASAIRALENSPLSCTRT